MEIHVELKTNSKMFCGCKNDPFHAEQPNIYTCPVCLGMPGGLPVPNKKAIEWTIMLAQALGCSIAAVSKFDRKNYFYPDLAKGYQISQYDQPIGTNGKLGNIRIRRVHLEEDTGKLQHATVDERKVTLVDFNRSGVPLVEIVTEADIRSGEEAKAFLKELHKIVRYLDISDANMEQGSMRLEPNISVKIHNSQLPIHNEIEDKDLPKYKVEVKNINSFNYVKKAIDFETKRHIDLLEKGEIPIQETRGWNEDKGVTFSQRRKENADDYRYFPDPDIPPIRFSTDQLLQIKNYIPELPLAKAERFIIQYQLNDQQVENLTDTKEMADYFEAVVQAGASIKPTVIANWIINKKVSARSVDPNMLVQTILAATQVQDVPEENINKAINKVLSEQPKAVADYKSGKTGVLMFLLGMTIKELKGKGDKVKIQEILTSALV